MNRRTLLAILPSLLTVMAWADKEHSDITGEVGDDHGNVSWKSSVEQSKGFWEYYYEAKNRSQNLNCRVNWVVPKQNWLIPPLETGYSRTSLTGKPIEYDGEFRYNGGPAAGEGVTKTAVWMDHDPKSKGTKTTATIFVDFEGKMYAVDLEASSQIDGDIVNYKLILKPAERTVGRYERNLEKLFPNCQVQWISMKSAAIKRKDLVTYKSGKYNEEFDIVQLDKGRESHSFDAFVSIKGLGEPTVSRGVLRFFVGEREDKKVLCEVGVPAIIPKAK
ncbi:MAG: hypothetical protein ACKVP0_24870 [Pirellulaceae bacterium]